MPIARRLFAAATKNSARPAICELNGRTWTYEQLTESALKIAGWLLANTPAGQPVVVRAEKTCETYAAFVGAIYAGRAFVPVPPQTPPARQKTILEITGPCAVYPWNEDATPPLRKPVDAPEGALAYIMFTSGSTGVPKAIGLTRANLEAFMCSSDALWKFEPDDRVSQIYEIGFEPVVSDFMWAFTSGACLCPLRALDLTATSAYLENRKITVWGSSPSFLKFVLDNGVIPRGRSFPDVRFSAFIGEKLPWELVDRWRQHAPNSIIENHYGPTETTLSVTSYRIRGNENPEDRGFGVPIGKAHPGQDLRMVDESLRLCAQEGELVISGSQVSPGYLNDDRKTAESFTRMDWDSSGRIWYRSGDRVRRRSDGAFIFLGRTDWQVKLRGQRFELGEIEARLSGQLGEPCVLAVFPWPGPSGSSGDSVVAVLSRRFDTGVLDAARENLFESLPHAAVPDRIFYLDPKQTQPYLNASAKLDRKALAQAVQALSLEQLWPRGS